METLIDQLGKTREQLLHEITSLSFDDFNRRFDAEKWSIAQVCHHLFITETLFGKSILYGLEKKKPVDGEHIPIQLVSDRTKKIQAPEISEPSSEPFQVPQIIQLLSDSRTTFMNVLSQIDDKSVLKTITVKNPVFGNLPLDQWVELLYLHEQRHIEQIKELKALC